jgi:hypothetical protein
VAAVAILMAMPVTAASAAEVAEVVQEALVQLMVVVTG